MLLAVDVGNTNTVLGLFEGDRLRVTWRVRTVADAMADEVRLQLAALLADADVVPGDVRDVALASVVPSLARVWREVGRALGARVLVVDVEAVSGLLDCSAYASVPGADRLADAVAGRDLVGAPCIVVDLGTATNMEVVDAQGRFAGGVIAPGLRSSAASLARGTALLPAIDLDDPGRAVGRSTVEAMQIGVVLGGVDAIDGLVRRIWRELGCEAPVVATGGFCQSVAELSATIGHVDPDLTLRGLRIISDHVRDRGLA